MISLNFRFSLMTSIDTHFKSKLRVLLGELLTLNKY